MLWAVDSPRMKIYQRRGTSRYQLLINCVYRTYLAAHTFGDLLYCNYIDLDQHSEFKMLFRSIVFCFKLTAYVLL